MPYRTVKKYSDRGSLKDLVQVQPEDLYSIEPTPQELRLKRIYEQSLLNKDSKLADSVGFIIMPESGNRASYPVSLYRHREYVKSLSAKLSNEINQFQNELSAYFNPVEDLPFEMKISQASRQRSLQTILGSETLLIKIAGQNVSVNKKRSFRRVR